MNKPTVVCLCGSTRFIDTFNVWRQRLTLEGKIVLSVEIVVPQAEREDPQHSNHAMKQMLDELHLRKIDLADEIMVLNVDGYIGESTSNEIAYAVKHGKPIQWLEDQGLAPYVCRKGHVTPSHFKIGGFGVISGEYCNMCLAEMLEPLRVKPMVKAAQTRIAELEAEVVALRGLLEDAKTEAAIRNLQNLAPRM